VTDRFTDARVPDPDIRVLFAKEHRWQCWLDVEAALAVAEAECGVIPAAAAEGRVFTAMTGGAAGTFASLGQAGPLVQDAVAARLGLAPMAVPSRAVADSFAEYVCLLGLLGATGTRFAHEVRDIIMTDRSPRSATPRRSAR
jgi:adenylosuccinate lyase